MPGIETDVPRECDRTLFRMDETPSQVLFIQRSKEGDQPHVQRFEKRKAGFDGHVPVIRQLRPATLVVCLDGWLVLRECPLKPHQAVHVAVTDMMNDLADRPASQTVRRVELLIRESFYRRSNLGRKFFDLVNPADKFLRGGFLVVLELAKGVAEGLQVVHGRCGFGGEEKGVKRFSPGQSVLGTG